MFSVAVTENDKLLQAYDDPSQLLHIVCINLITLSKVETDDYLITNKDLFAVQRTSEYRLIPIGLFRMYYGFSRETTLQNLRQLYAGARHLLKNVHLTEEESKKLQQLVEKSCRGLKKLQITYIKDTAVYSQIQVLIDETKRGVFKTEQQVVDGVNLNTKNVHLGFC